MKLMIASDIHGSARWCSAMLDAWRAERPEKLILLGDLLYHGPRNDLPDEYAPKKVIAMLNPLAAELVCVRGNCEAEVDQMVLDFPCMDDYATLDDGGQQLFLTHGHVWGPGFHNSIERMPELVEGDALLYGHTHIRVLSQMRGITIFNPGSVGIPKDGRHTYGIYDRGTFEHREL